MGAAKSLSFQERVNKIDRNHRKMSRGYTRLVERDGMLIPVPARRPRRQIPFAGILLTLSAFFAFKGAMLAHLGPRTYAERIGELGGGDLGEKFGAWAMATDPVTTWIAAQMALFI